MFEAVFHLALGWPLLSQWHFSICPRPWRPPCWFQTAHISCHGLLPGPPCSIHHHIGSPLSIIQTKLASSNNLKWKDTSDLNHYFTKQTTEHEMCDSLRPACISLIINHNEYRVKFWKFILMICKNPWIWSHINSIQQTEFCLMNRFHLPHSSLHHHWAAVDLIMEIYGVQNISNLSVSNKICIQCTLSIRKEGL